MFDQMCSTLGVGFLLLIDSVCSLILGLNIITDREGGKEQEGGQGVLVDGGRERKPADLNPEETTGRMRNQWRDR